MLFNRESVFMEWQACSPAQKLKKKKKIKKKICLSTLLCAHRYSPRAADSSELRAFLPHCLQVLGPRSQHSAWCVIGPSRRCEAGPGSRSFHYLQARRGCWVSWGLSELALWPGGVVLVTDEEISKRRSQEHTQQIGFYILTSTSNVLQKIMVTSNSIIPAVPFCWEFPMLQLQKLQTGLAEPQEAWEAECYSHVSTERGKEQMWFVFEKTNRNTLNLRCWQSYKFYCFRG